MENLTLLNTKRPNHSFEIRVVRREPIAGVGMNSGYLLDQVHRVHARLDKGSQNRRIQLIQKPPVCMEPGPDDGTIEGQADSYLYLWESLRAAEIPTIPTVRKISNEDVIMTDLEANGSVLYDKLLRDNLMRGGKKPPQDMNEKFLSINPNHILDSAQEIMERATRSRIELPFDNEALSLLLSPAGNWRLLVVDFEEVILNTPDAKEANISNFYCFERIIRDLTAHL